MVRIIDYKVHQNKDGEPFLALIVQESGIQLVKSQKTGMYYAIAKKASIPSTFDEETCKSLIGQELEGTVERVDCEPYEFTNEETGEVMVLDHRWVFVQEGETVQQAVEEEVPEEEPELV
jgi:hypothetical protein